MEPPNDQTTATFVSFDDGPTAWYLVVSVGGASSRMVPIHDNAELVFGRQPDCSVVIDHDGVSRRHARVMRMRDQITVEDLESRNGTLVNGDKITGPRRIVPGDVLSIGPASAILATSSSARHARQVATVGELEDRLEAEVDRAGRYRRRLGLVMVKLDGTPEDTIAHVDVLIGQLRRMDFIAEYGADELAIVLPEAGPEAVAAVADRARSGGPSLAAAAGVSTFPDDGTHAGELIAVARERMRGGKPAKRSRSQRMRIDPAFVAIDPMMKHVFELAERAAASLITVLVVGETGVGKEVVAETVHRAGTRAGGPLVRLNCASLSDTLVESELFGHEKGAFTGAVAAKPGFFETASGGTLFLDEIGELPITAQAKVLRAIEQRKVVRVGGTAEIPVDVRLVCATNRDLEAEVARQRFRADLFFRISAFVIPVPPLRDRKIEIAPLATKFVRDLSPDSENPAVIAANTLEALKLYDWPGNVRELRNVIERAVVLSAGGVIEPQHLPDRIQERMPVGTVAQSVRPLDVRYRVSEVERDTIVAALDATRGNQTHAARKLGVSRFALIRLMEKHDLKTRPR